MKKTNTSSRTRFDRKGITLVKYESWETQVGDIKGQYERGELIPDPEWQRGYIWNLKDERLLIDSILRNLPIPKFYLTEEFYAKKGAFVHYVVDGQQRIKAIYRFLKNGYSIQIGEKEYNFKDLDIKTQERLTGYKLNGHYMVDYTPSDVTFLFQRLNSTGIKLTNMEFWNSEYHGTNILKMVRDIYENVLDFPPKRDYRDYDDSDYEKLQKSYVAAIYTEENIKRMLPLDDIIDLSNCLLKGKVESGNKNELSSFLKNKADIKARESSTIKTKFKSILEIIREIFSKQDLEQSTFVKRTHFISLFLAIGLLTPEYHMLTNPQQLRKDLLIFINDQPEDYKESVTGGIRHKERRELRVNYFRKIILRYATKANEKGISV